MTGSPILAISGVRKSFGGLQVLTDVSLECPEGAIIGLIGPNGAGKTTLFNIITGLIRPEGGVIAFRGTAIQGMPAHVRARRGIARTFQHPRLFPQLSVLENVMAGAFHRTPELGSAEEAASEWLRRTALAHRASSDVRRLTLLERKFVEVARAMASHPDLVLLDEFMAGLNPTELEDALALVRTIRTTGTSVVLIEHVMSAVMTLSERVHVLASGRIIASGTPAEVTRHPEVLQAYLGEHYGA